MEIQTWPDVDERGLYEYMLGEKSGKIEFESSSVLLRNSAMHACALQYREAWETMDGPQFSDLIAWTGCYKYGNKLEVYRIAPVVSMALYPRLGVECLSTTLLYVAFRPFLAIHRYKELEDQSKPKTRQERVSSRPIQELKDKFVLFQGA